MMIAAPQIGSTNKIKTTTPKKSTTTKKAKSTSASNVTSPSTSAYTTPLSNTSIAISNPSADNVNDQINKLYDAQQKTQLDTLKQTQKKAVDAINLQKNQTQQDYYNQKNQADVTNQQNVQRLRELMAANGLTGSGENITANVNLANQRQSSLNDLSTKEQQQLDQYNQKIQEANDPMQTQTIKDQVAQARAQALSNQMWNNYQFNNVSATNQASNALQWANDQATLQQQQAALQQQIAALQNSGFSGVSGGGGSYQSDLANAMAVDKMPASQVPYFDWIIQHESSYNPNAQNKSSTAHGYGQFLNSTASEYDKKMGLNYNGSPTDQLIETYQYMVDRYGSPQGAMNFWQQHGWY